MKALVIKAHAELKAISPVFFAGVLSALETADVELIEAQRAAQS